MAEDRPVNDVVDELAQQRKKLADLETTQSARWARRPTGCLEMTLRTTAPPDTLILDGSTPLRATYPALWQLAQDQGWVTTGPFTVGNGTTTFGLPDWRNRVPRGINTGDPIGQLLGADSITLTISQLPSHGHGISGDGGHGGHFPADVHEAAPQAGGLGLAAWNDGGSGVSNHDHGGGTGNTGSGSSIDIRQRSFGINWLIYT